MVLWGNQKSFFYSLNYFPTIVFPTIFDNYHNIFMAPRIFSCMNMVIKVQGSFIRHILNYTGYNQ